MVILDWLPPFPQWKGNVHCHTTLSDGGMAPEAVVELYATRGYDFLAVSDHERYWRSNTLDRPSFVTLPAIEYAVQRPPGGRKGYHIQGLWAGTPRGESTNVFENGQILDKYAWTSPYTVQRAHDRLRSHHNLTVFNHPVESCLDVEDFLYVEGLFGLEIFNYGSEVGSNTGHGQWLWDQLLRRGRKLYGFASDDYHGGSNCCGGWIMVCAPALTADDLGNSIRQGRFYSSNGPAIHRYYASGDEIGIECSPIHHVDFISAGDRERVSADSPTATIQQARYRIRGDEVFIRVECTDLTSRTAWAQPVFLEDFYQAGLTSPP